MSESTTTLKLDDAVRQRLKALGDKRKRSPHYLMKEAIETYLDREEEYERQRDEDMARWERYQLTGQVVSQERVLAWLAELAEGKDTPCPK
jgi:predicted transcriptional regulator